MKDANGLFTGPIIGMTYLEPKAEPYFILDYSTSPHLMNTGVIRKEPSMPKDWSPNAPMYDAMLTMIEYQSRKSTSYIWMLPIMTTLPISIWLILRALL